MGHFVIIAAARTGSTLLCDSVLQHPEIDGAGEILHPGSKDGWENPVEYLESFYQGAAHKGFKLLYYQTDNARTIEWLQAKPNLQVIHLTRSNQLQRYVSFRIAGALRQWERPAGEPPLSIPRIYLTADAARGAFLWYRKKIDLMDRTFGSHPLLHVTYEDLTASYSDVMNRVFEFIGVSPHPCIQRYEKFIEVPMREVIANYDNLKWAFRNSPEAAYFD